MNDLYKFLAGAAMALPLLVGCDSGSGNDTASFSAAEEQLIAEQTVSALSGDEDSALYVVDELCDPAYYESLEGESSFSYDVNLGSISVSASASSSYGTGDFQADLVYTLYDSQGQSLPYFQESVTAAEVGMHLTLAAATLLYESRSSLDSHWSVKGLNGNTLGLDVSLNGNRTTETTSAANNQYQCSLDYSGTLDDLVITYDASVGMYYVALGQGTFSVQGTLNGKSFKRTVSISFTGNGIYTLVIGGKAFTVDMATGEIL